MTKLTDFLNRAFILLVGLSLLAAGALSVGLYFDVAFAQRLVDSLRPREWDTIPYSPWFLFSVGALGVLALILGILGLVANLRRHRVWRLSSNASTPLGSIDFDINEVAQAAAQTFTELPKVIRSRAVVQVDRGRRVMTISVDSEASVALSQLTDHARVVEQDIHDAISGAEIDIVFKFHMAPVERLAN
ncbi:hypothetical protein CKALI_10225 [Corynebacterium kalinowskii]|uniref:Alkaline shock response membrane anchor protein AmaP n=1 Tax=Corynebacterium kalinowskii TaxID=2675216 RepID=A0A6B8VZZ4_9CORY|nr:hypothetical protein [Corynebacterium kalinowskii]QGU02900.1 hypothetical protein CKALI_10225 [Corynebacterium kalinowskii]